jgi:hypothetical protein
MLTFAVSVSHAGRVSEKAIAQPAAAAVSIWAMAPKGGATDNTRHVAFSAVCTSGGGTIGIPPGTHIINPAAASYWRPRGQGPGTLKVS